MTPQEFQTDNNVLELVQKVLSQAGYTTEKVAHKGTVLLAENAYFVIALTATTTIDGLLIAESQVEELLHDRIKGVDLGPKRWDAYVVLLTQEQPTEEGEGLQPLFSIAYDTQSFRRITRVEVRPTIRGVRNALTPFIEPVRLEDAGLSDPPLESMVAALVRNGVEKDLVSWAVDTYREGGRLHDTL